MKMDTFIHASVIEKMRSKNTWSFYIVELKSQCCDVDLIVDVVESEDNALAKCKYIHENHDVKCKYYQTGVDNFEQILEITKDFDVVSNADKTIGLPYFHFYQVDYK